MDEDVIVKEFTQVGRVLMTAAGQWRERALRATADRDRARQAALAEDQQRLRRAAEDQAKADREARIEQQRADEQQRRENLKAGRSVYGEVRRIGWDTDMTARRVGEAFVAATAMADQDPVAQAARAYLVAEVKARYGPRADEWLAEAIQQWQQLQAVNTSELAHARSDLEQQTTVDRDQAEDDLAAVEDEQAEREVAARHEVVRAVDQVKVEKQRIEDEADQEVAVRADGQAELPRSPATPPEKIAEQLRTATEHRQSYPYDAAEEVNRPRKRRPARAAATPRGRERERASRSR